MKLLLASMFLFLSISFLAAQTPPTAEDKDNTELRIEYE
jgi:hypothetical protein